MLIGLEFFTHSWLGTFIKLVDGSFPLPGLTNFPVVHFSGSDLVVVVSKGFVSIDFIIVVRGLVALLWNS